MLIDLNGTWIDSDHVIAVREVPKHKTNVWCTGQSAVDGAFLIDMECADVIEALNAVQMHKLAEQLLEDMESDPTAAH